MIIIKHCDNIIDALLDSRELEKKIKNSETEIIAGHWSTKNSRKKVMISIKKEKK